MGRRKKRRRLPVEKARDGSVDDDGSIREELLASLMAGTLGKLQRLEVARYLAANSDARETLLMAYQAIVSERRSNDDKNL